MMQGVFSNLNGRAILLEVLFLFEAARARKVSDEKKKK